MAHSISQCKHDFESEVTSQTDSICDSSVNDALIAIAQEVAELLKQSCLVQADESDGIELADGNRSAERSAPGCVGKVYLRRDASITGLWFYALVTLLCL